MARRTANFDRLAGIYRALEFLAFGRDLERARFSYLDCLRDRRDILIFGEGDGRCLARLVDVAPWARIHCIEASPAMIARAKSRLAEKGALARVHFENADAFSVRLEPGRYDAVLTLFFLDCFPTAEVEKLAGAIGTAARLDARWLFADFVMPERGWARRRARLWLALLYAFFRWQTGLPAKSLPDSEGVIARAGWRPEAIRDFQRGLVRSAVYVRE